VVEADADHFKEEPVEPPMRREVGLHECEGFAQGQRRGNLSPWDHLVAPIADGGRQQILLRGEVVVDEPRRTRV